MRKPLRLYSNIKVEDMTSSNQSFDVEETRVERVCKILSSPLNKKKSSSSSSSNAAVERTFGISLDDLVRRANNNSGIPFVVQRLCDYIEYNGFHHEGLFRVSGSLRTMEKLRVAFDRSGDADLEEVGDVMAAACLLKQFLRTLPEPVIPSSLHDKFVNVQQEYYQENEEYIRQLKRLVEQLPEINFNLLKYLMGFLVKVSSAEEYNRMNASSLGIVFGPSVFRVVDTVEGLREQAFTNQIVTKFVKDYLAVFEVDTTTPLSQRSSVQRDVTDFGAATSSTCHVPCPIIRALQPKNLSESFMANRDESLIPKLELSSASSSMSLSIPFIDSPNDVSFDEKGNEIIEMTISNTVCQHLFGVDDEDLSSPRPPPRLKHKKLELSPDGAANNKLARSNSEERSTVKLGDGLFLNFGLAIRKCSSDENVLGAEGSEQSSLPSVEKTKTDTGFLKKFESHPVNSSRFDHAMTPLNIDTSSHATPDLRKREWGRHHDGENDHSEARRSVERLQNISQFQRSAASKGRRTPTLKGSRRCASMEVMRGDADEDSLKENVLGHSTRNDRGDRSHMTKQFQKRSSSFAESPTLEGPSAEEDDPMQDAEVEKRAKGKNSNGNKPRLWLLDLHAASSAGAAGAANHDDGTSPSSAHKPYIPPLDLSKLHEHGDGSDPIPTNHLRASWPFIHHHQMMDDEVMLSPRTTSLEKKSNVFVDPNIPPSPPIEQDVGRKSATFKDEEQKDASFKALNKKISSLKRKVKQFEDGFEEENGYRPSHAEKMSRGDVKKYLSDLVKARKELKQLKEEARLVTMATTCSLSSTTVQNNGAPIPADVSAKYFNIMRPSMQDSLDEMLKKVSDKRKLANRPEALEDMSREEILEEKLAIQKALLHFENIHGRPTTKQEKELMKPIYERYRNVKRLAAKASSPKMKDPSMELQPILEHETMDFTQASPKHQKHLVETADNAAAVNNTTAVQSDELFQQMDSSASTPFNVDEERLVEKEQKSAKRKLVQEDSCNLHELSHDKLLEQEFKVRGEKKRLRRILREFEEEFQRQTGRKAQREDRAPLDSVYIEYKQVKAKLKLLEALLVKHEHHYTI